MTTYELGDSNPGPLQALVFVRLSDPSPVPFERFLSGTEGVVAAWHVIGDIDLAVQVHCPDLVALDQLLTAMRTEGGAVSTTTHLVVRQADLTPAPDLHCPQLPWHPSGTGITFQAPQSAARRHRSLRRAGR
ncbi:Lrp/AsnC ligand binding domain-containing protein [Dactylosporangium sp. NPDC049525]|uniref:Lrp/AsnC ligand binding domain-containing protein n=1 Tax=Dactylosporangium sp. NPDC049525 TaxID=3154730 RepID=UPI00342EC6D6